MTNENEPLLVPVKDAAVLLSLTPWSVYQKADRGELDSVYQGRRRYILMESIRRYVANLPTRSSA